MPHLMTKTYVKMIYDVSFFNNDRSALCPHLITNTYVKMIFDVLFFKNDRSAQLYVPT